MIVWAVQEQNLNAIHRYEAAAVKHLVFGFESFGANIEPDAMIAISAANSYSTTQGVRACSNCRNVHTGCPGTTVNALTCGHSHLRQAGP